MSFSMSPFRDFLRVSSGIICWIASSSLRLSGCSRAPAMTACRHPCLQEEGLKEGNLEDSPTRTWAPVCRFWPKIELIARLESASRRVGTKNVCKADAGRDTSMLVWVNNEQD